MGNCCCCFGTTKIHSDEKINKHKSNVISIIDVNEEAKSIKNGHNQAKKNLDKDTQTNDDEIRNHTSNNLLNANKISLSRSNSISNSHHHSRFQLEHDPTVIHSILAVLESKEEIHWDYHNPNNWKKQFPDANGKHQSPIDLKKSMAIFHQALSDDPIEIKHDKEYYRLISNNGHTFLVTAETKEYSNLESDVTGRLLKKPYKFLQFHMHWGKNNKKGSEHLVNGKSYPAELHFVYWNNEDYKDPNDAATSNEHDGLLVLGIFLKLIPENDKNEPVNEEINKIIRSLPFIKLIDQSYEFEEELDVSKLFPNDLKSYWTYPGSLTTPPCSESVKWIVFEQPIGITSYQLSQFRNLHECKTEEECCDKTAIKANFRPCCKLNDRILLKSFKQ